MGMKSVIYTSLPLFSVTYAGIIEMRRDFEDLKVAALQNDTAQMRNIGNTFDQAFDSFDGYGCWCYFEEEHGKGRGQAVDEVDQVCKKLANGYECAMMDTANTCIPWEVNYVSGIGGGPDAINSRCASFNANACSEVACILEGHFVQEMMTMILFGTGVDSQYHNSNFDVSSECITYVGGGPADKECCGVHPWRKPFHTRGATNACCSEAKVYNTLTHDCCLDGEVRESC